MSTGQDCVGRKAATLGRLAALVSVPDHVVLPAHLFLTLPLDAAAIDVIVRRIARLGPGPFAVRSSAVEEDDMGRSFAGVFVSRLDVTVEGVPAAAAEVAASYESKAAQAYRAATGLGATSPGGCAVIVQRQIEARAAGVAFTADPRTGETGSVFIEAVAGCAGQLLSGQARGHAWSVRASDRHIAATTPSVPWLSAADLRAVARLALTCERALGRPQDVEWAIDADGLWLIQSRPITAMPNAAMELQTVFDRSNIGENFPGVVSPLTYTFARRIYGHVFGRFLVSAGMSRGAVRAWTPELENLIARIDGYLYYNLTSWSLLVDALPCAGALRPALERMFGMTAPFPPARPELIRSRASSSLRTVWMVLVLGIRLAALRWSGRRFSRRVAQTLGEIPEDLRALPARDLAAQWRRLECELLDRWTVPIFGDLAAMLLVGFAECLSRRGNETGASGACATLVAGAGDNAALEMVRDLRCMAERCAEIPGMAALLKRGQLPPREIAPELASAVSTYLRRFGDRIPEELKLESPSLASDPRPLLRSIAAISRTCGGQTTKTALGAAVAAPPRRVRRGARWASALACRSLAARETLRLDRTLLFGAARRLAVAMGERFAAEGLLNDPRDVFCLTVEELLGAIEGSACDRDLLPIVEMRRAEMERLACLPEPPIRRVVSGPAGFGHRTAADRTVCRRGGEENVRRGLATSSGMATGRARICRNPMESRIDPGDIVVAGQTDPGWVLLLVQAGAIVAERGSLLSHAAVLARELGIPCVVNLPGAMQWLADEPIVCVDGGDGTVTRVRPVKSQVEGV